MDDFFAMLILPVYVDDQQQDRNCWSWLSHPKGVPALLSRSIVDAIHVDKATLVFENQRRQIE
jgi:hypothetical protein